MVGSSNKYLVDPDGEMDPNEDPFRAPKVRECYDLICRLYSRKNCGEEAAALQNGSDPDGLDDKFKPYASEKKPAVDRKRFSLWFY